MALEFDRVATGELAKGPTSYLLGSIPANIDRLSPPPLPLPLKQEPAPADDKGHARNQGQDGWTALTGYQSFPRLPRMNNEPLSGTESAGADR